MVDEIRLDSPIASGAQRGSAAGLRVIVVDAHPSYAHGLASLLRAVGDIEVVAITHDAEVGVERAIEHKPDVVLVDVRLPERSGIELTRKITAHCPGVKVAILTASTAPTDVIDAKRAGARGYLLKQSDAGELVAGIKSIAAGKTVVAFSLRSVFDGLEEADNPLTAVEVHLLKLLARGLELEAVARELDVSASTVKRQTVQVQRKLGVDNRIQAVVAAARRGLL